MTSETKVRGAGRCPKCGSRRVKELTLPPTGFYAEKLEACANCKAFWEPFDPAQLLDTDAPTTSSFKEPCDNCAFRPGSPEQKDAAKWKELMASLKANGRFYCHKGVPIVPGSKHGFAYPEKAVSKELCPGTMFEDVKKLRMCRGWLMMWGERADKGIANAESDA
jgi:hypothetical protein